MPEITVRHLDESEYALVAGWLSNPDINRWLYVEWRDREIDEKLIAITSRSGKSRMWLGLVDGKPYGIVAIGGVSAKDRSGIAWYLRGAHVDREPGAMTNCVTLALRLAFRELGLHSVTASIQADNIASERLLKAIGFQRVGVLREAFLVGDQFVDRVQFDLLESEFLLI